MPKCSSGHDGQTTLKCQKCGAKVQFKEALPELIELPSLDVKFEEVAVLFIGNPPIGKQGVYTAEMLLGKGAPSARRFVAGKLEGGTWLDYNARYSEAFRTWLRLVEFTRSRYRVLVLDSTNPLAVLAVNNIPSPETTVLLASYPGRASTPISQNTSYAALQLARRRGMHVVLAVDSYIEHLTVFVEGRGLSTGEKAYDQVVAYLVAFLPDVVDLVQKDARLGIGNHFFSVLLSASDKVFRSTDDALSIELNQNSLGGSYERVLTTHLLASSAPEARKGISSAFSRISTRQGEGLMNAEFRYREKPTSYGLYDLFLLFAVKEPSVFEDLRRGYQTIASSAPDLSLEGGLAPAAPPHAAEPTETIDEEQPLEDERSEPRQLTLMKEFVQTRGEVFDLLLQVRGDPREALLRFAAEVPPDKPPLEGLLGAYKDWLDGAFDEFASSLSEKGEKEGPSPEFLERLSAIAYNIGSVQNSIFSGNAEERKRSLDALAELGVDKPKLEGVSLLNATDLLIHGAEAAMKRKERA